MKARPSPPGSDKALSVMAISSIFLPELLAEAAVLMPTSPFTRPDLQKTRTEKIQVYFVFLLLVYPPSLSSYSPAFPSATINIRMFLSSLNNYGDCQRTAKFRELEAWGKHHKIHSKTTAADHTMGAASAPQ